MRIQENKKFFVLFYMLGFLVGIFYANVFSKDYIASMGIFNEFFLSQYAQTDVVMGEYMWYVVRVRVLPLVLIGALSCTRLRKSVVVCFLAWTGFSSGMILTSAVMKMGLKGVILCLMSLTPQFVFYIAAYLVLLWYLFDYPKAKWNLTKTTFFLTLLGMGIILECYVNPILMKMFLKTL